MHFKPVAVVTVLSLLAFGGVALAQGAKAPPAMPTPAAELSQLKYFVGAFQCKGRAFESPFGPAHATEAKVEIDLELDGFWYTGRYTETKTQENPHPFEIDFTWGYESAGKTFTASTHDNTGGSAMQTSSGWAGDKLVFDGTSMGMGMKAKMRDTFTKKGPDEVVHLAEMELNGKWTKLDEETCKRAGAK